MWHSVQRWLEDSNLPFRYSVAAPDEDLLFPQVYAHWFDYLLRAAKSCIVIKKLPETFYHPFFMYTLLVNGKICCFRRRNGDLIALNVSQAAQPDLYYVPERAIVVNPKFRGESYNLTPGVDCEIIYCTSQDMYTYGLDTGGLYSLISITARMLADNTISLNVAQRNTRLTNVLAADDEITARSIDNVLRDMYAGKPYKAVQKTLIDKLENVPIQQQQSNQNLLQLLETHKYILSEFYAALGIDEPQQMKRERLVTAEVEQGAELPLFNIWDIYQSIKEGVERVNKMFGTEIEVEINPIILEAFADNSGTDAELPDQDDGEEALPDMVIQPAASADDTTADDQTAGEDQAGADGTTAPAEPEPEPEGSSIVDNAVEIIEAAADIIQEVAGGEDQDDAEQSEDQDEAGEDRRDPNDGSGD